jgi:hypothetical protein
MLDAQVVVDLLLKRGIRMNLGRHGNFLNEGSSQIAFRFNSTGSLAVTLPLLRVRGIFYCY